MKFAAILAALVALSFAGEAAAQESFVFASPDTRASLTDEDARVSLTSFEELNAIAIADRIACSMTAKVGISAVLGMYDTSSENSLLIESDLKRKETEYLGSLLGRYERQKFVLLFFPQAAGRDRLWTIHTPKSFGSAVAAVRQVHLIPVTLRTGAAGIEIWIVDMGDKFAQEPNQLAARLGGTATSQDGTADLLGDDDRVKSAAIFGANISAFEQTEKPKLSSRRWTEAWHDASTRTCSVEVPK
ncbi:MAG: hypothetical protein WA581_03595 [Candidatus Acidiferrales bacterium]